MPSLKTLRDRIANDIRRVGDPVITDTLGGLIDQKINVAKLTMVMDNNFKAMEQIAQVALAIDTQSYPQPDRFKSIVSDDEDGSVKVMKTDVTPNTIVTTLEGYSKARFDRLTLITDPEPRFYTVQEIDDALNGIPLAFSLYREEFYLFPVTSDSSVVANRSLEISFYQVPEDYDSNDDEDFFLTQGYNALYYGAMAELMPVLRQDHRVEFFTIKAEAFANQAAKVSLESENAGATQHIRG